MSDTITNRQLKARFELWSEFKLKSGTTQAELDMIHALVRQDIADGPDNLREGEAKIDDPQVRRRLWYNFFGEVLITLEDFTGVKDDSRPNLHEAVTILTQAKTDEWREACLEHWEDKYGKAYVKQIKDQMKKGSKNGKR